MAEIEFAGIKFKGGKMVLRHKYIVMDRNPLFYGSKEYTGIERRLRKLRKIILKQARGRYENV